MLAVVVQSLPGVRLGGVSFGEPLVQGQKKKKETMGITILPPRRFWFLILFSFCLPTVQLHFTPILNFKQSTHAKKNLSSVFSYPLYMYISILFFRKQTTHTHTRTHTKSSLGMLLIFFFYGLLPCCLFWC